MNNGETLPQSPEAEKGLLGSILLAPENVLNLCDQQHVTTEYFLNPVHGKIFTVLASMREASAPIDLVSVTSYLEGRNLLKRVGGAVAITDLFTFVPSGSNAKYYIQILRERAIARRMIKASKQLAQTANSPTDYTSLPERVRDVFSQIDLPEPTDGELFVDLEKIIACGLKPERPTVAQVLPGKCLLYAARLNEIHGEPGIGKTNIALSISISVMADGGHVLFIDPEDTATGTLNRLIGLGANIGHVLEGFHYLHNPTPEEFDRAISWAAKHAQALVVLDGLAEAMTAEGKNEDIPMDVLPFLRQRLRPFAEQGASVLISDHVTKDKESRGRWSRGSGAKLGRYDGAVYSAELVEPYSPTVAGKVRLRVSKDRNGGIGVAGQVVAEINFTPQEDKTLVAFQEPSEVKPFKPTVIMEKIMDRLKVFPDSSKRDLYPLGKHEWVEEAIIHLAKDGFLSVANGKNGQKMKFTVLKPYFE